MDDAEAREFLRQAATCRRLALHTTDDAIMAKLIALAEEYEARAAAAGEK